MTLEEKYPLNADCLALDESLNSIMEEIVVLRQNPNQNTSEINKLENWKTGLEFAFKGKRCRDYIEMKRLSDSANIITSFSASQESQIIPKKNKEQMLYIGLGGVVLLVSLYLFLNKNKNE